MTRPAPVLWLRTGSVTPAGLLGRAAWQALTAPGVRVLAPRRRRATATALIEQGVVVEILDEPQVVATIAAAVSPVVWLAGPEDDAALREELESGGTRVDTLLGSWDPSGAAVLEAAAVVDHLRSPGGCPWDAQQTHASLRPYLIEEAFEADEAIASGDSAHLREELGDVLFQVLFHGRVAQEDPDGFDLDDIAVALVEKLRRRHPHVFAGEQVADADEVERRWESIKAQEKSDRDAADLLAGIPQALPVPLVVDKVRARLRRGGRAGAFEPQLSELAADATADDRRRRDELAQLVRSVD